MRDDFRYSFSGADCKVLAYFPGEWDRASQSESRFTLTAKEITDKKQIEKDILLHEGKIQEANKKSEAAIKDIEELITSINNLEQAGTIPAAEATKLRIPHQKNIKNIRIKTLKHIELLHQKGGTSGGIDALRKKLSEIIGGATKRTKNATMVHHLDTMATISFSVHEPKGIVRALGYRGPKGFSRSVRTIAGSMIFVVVEGHPLEKLLYYDPTTSSAYGRGINARKKYAGYRNWSQDSSAGVGLTPGDTTTKWLKPPTMLPPFNLLLQYVSEYADYSSETPKLEGDEIESGSAHLQLKNIEFINEGIVTSVNDMVTEVVYQFVAQDYHQFTRDFKRNSPEEIVRELSRQTSDEGLSEADKIALLFEALGKAD